MRLFLLLVILILTCSQVFAEESYRYLAVLAPDVKNCDASFSSGIKSAVRASLADGLSASSVRLAQDDSSADILIVGAHAASEALFIKKQNSSSADLALAVCIEGSVDNHGDNAQSKYRVVQRVIGTADSGVSFTVSSPWVVKTDISRAIMDISAETAHYVTKKFRVPDVDSVYKPVTAREDATSHFLYGLFAVSKPAGDYAQIAGRGIGPSLHYGYSGFAIKGHPCAFRGSMSYQAYKTNIRVVSRLRTGYFTTGAGPIFAFSHISLLPHVGGGLFFSYVKFSSYNAGDRGYEKYADPAVYAAFDFAFKVSSCSVVVQPQYVLFFEKGALGRFMSGALGAGYRF